MRGVRAYQIIIIFLRIFKTLVMENIKSLIAAGGTGGHLFPAIAVAEEFKVQTGNKFEAFFVGNSERLEARIVPAQGYSFTPIPIRGFSGVFSASTLTLPFKIIKSVSSVRKIIKKEKPDFVLCTGAYISYPAGLAASQMNIPLVLMESNVAPGKTIKILSSKADLIITTFEATKDYFPHAVRSNVICLGNPLRKMFENIHTQPEARAKFGLEPDKKTVLIFGGSLGAGAINNAARTAFDIFEDKDIQFLWQTGKDYKLSGSLPANVKMLEFIDDMASAYTAADLVIARSGATTVSELCYTGKPSILVPLPGASNNEQAANAVELEKNSAAVIINNDVIGAKLAENINLLLNDDAKLKTMSQNAEKLAKKNAAADAVKSIMKLIKKQSV